jgi:hypothetical protein
MDNTGQWNFHTDSSRSFIVYWPSGTWVKGQGCAEMVLDCGAYRVCLYVRCIEDWIDLAQDKGTWQDLVKTVMKFQVI